MSEINFPVLIIIWFFWRNGFVQWILNSLFSCNPLLPFSLLTLMNFFVIIRVHADLFFGQLLLLHFLFLSFSAFGNWWLFMDSLELVLVISFSWLMDLSILSIVFNITFSKIFLYWICQTLGSTSIFGMELTK